MHSIKKSLTALATLGVLASVPGCSSKSQYIGNTTVEANPENERVVAAMERYRIAMENRDTSKLLMMASRNYHDESGTVQDANDNLGYEQLKDALALRVSRASDIRYSLRYKKIRIIEDRALVEALVDAAFTYKNADGVEQRHTLRDTNQFVLVRDGENWLFQSGM